MSQTVHKLTIKNKEGNETKLTTGANVMLELDDKPLKGVKFLKLELKAANVAKVLMEMYVNLNVDINVQDKVISPIVIDRKPIVNGNILNIKYFRMPIIGLELNFLYQIDGCVLCHKTIKPDFSTTIWQGWAIDKLTEEIGKEIKGYFAAVNMQEVFDLSEFKTR
jgi:hypothetical protein